MTAEPSIEVRKLRANDLFLIFASDGLWEQLTDEDAVEIVFKNPRPVSLLFSSVLVKPLILSLHFSQK